MPRLNLAVRICLTRRVGLAGWLVAIALSLAAGCAESSASKPALAINDEPPAKESTDVADQPEKTVATAHDPEPLEDDLPPEPFPRKIPIPPEALTGGVEWLNTAGPITLESLRGKVVLLDFWTYCCINCMHVLPDLKRLEEKYPNQLVVIGVHSAKFDTERDSQNIREAILRYEISHPVVNDANMIVWRHFDVHSWPTLLLIDPESNVIGYLSGEGVFEALDQAIDRVVKYHRVKGTLNEAPVHFELERSRATDTPLRFPGKLLADAASDRLFISDSNHNRIVITTLSGRLVDVVGAGSVGRTDGAFDQATFFRPQGLALDGELLYIADTENHMIRRADLKARTVSTIAGVGEQGSNRSHQPKPAKEAALNSPWDLWFREGKLYVAMAGPHQIWLWNSATDEIHAFAGSGREDIEDGEAQFAALAQPSGLASDGTHLFVADSEVSGIRTVLMESGEVSTVVGQGLFEFGDVDGEGREVRLQHPLGVTWHDGVLYVADTYNNKIKAVDPFKRTSISFLGEGEPGKNDEPPQFDEPGGLSIAGDKLYIADTNNHAIRIADLKTKKVTTLELSGLIPVRTQQTQPQPVFPNSQSVSLDQQTLAAGADIELRVNLKLPEHFELNEIAPLTYLVETFDSDGSLSGDVLGKVQRVKPPAASFPIPLKTAAMDGDGKIRVSLTYYRCREGAGGLCEVRSVIWEMPVHVAADASRTHIDLTTPAPTPPTRGTKLPSLLEKKED